MADEKITATVTLDSAQIEAALQRIVDGYMKSKQGAEHAQEATKNLEGSHKELADSANKSAEGVKYLSEQMEQMGIEAGGATKIVNGLAGSFHAFTEFGPLLLGLGAALAGVGLAMWGLKEAIDAAAESERQLVSVMALIRNQGSEGWKEQSKAVEELAVHLARTSTFMKSDIVSGMQSMLAYGVPVNDMMRSQAAALDLAAAKGVSAQEAETMLAMAYDGRTMALKRLGLVTADEAKNGIAYDVILDRIEKRMGGSAKDALDTYTGAQENVKNKMEALLDTFGSGFMPVLTDFIKKIGEGVDSFQPLADQFKQFTTENAPLFKQALSDIADIFGKMASTWIPAFVHGVEDGLTGLAKFAAWYHDNGPGVERFWSVVVGSIAVLALGALGGAITGATSALAAFVVEETIATFGLNVLIGAIVAGAVWAWNHWDEFCDGMSTGFDGTVKTITSLWDNLVVIIDNAMENIMASVGKGLKGMADIAKNVPFGLGNGAADALTAASGAAFNTANGFAINAAHHTNNGNDTAPPKITGGSIEKGNWGAPGKTKPAKPPKPEKPPGLPPSTNHFVPGTATGAKGSSSAPTFSTQDVEKYVEKIDEAARVQKLLEQNLKDLDASLDGDKEAVNSATTAHDKHVAQLKLEADQKVELTNKGLLLQNAIDAEKAKMGSLTQTYNDAVSHQHNIADAIAEFNREITAAGGPTLQQTNDLAALKDENVKANKAITAASAAITENTNNLKTNTDAQRANNAAKAASKVAYDQFLEKLDEERIKHAQVLADEKATYGLSTEQQIAYYTQKRNALDQSNKDNWALIQEYDNKIYALDTKAFQDRMALLKKFNDDAKADIQTFLDDIIVQHKSFGDVFKSIWQKIEQQFIAQIAQMIVAGNAFKSLFSGLFGGAGSGSGFNLSSIFGAGGGDSSSAPLSMAGVGALGPTTVSNSMTLLPGMAGYSAGGNNVIELGTQTIDTVTKNLTGSTSGVSPFAFTNAAGGATLIGTLAVAAGAFGIGSAVGGLVGGAGSPNAKENGGIGALLGVGGVVGAQALMTGVGMGPALGALLASGPAGWAILAGAAVLGGVAGGMIGPHWGPASNYPDRGPDQATYGQFEANWQGSNGNVANGTTYNADSTHQYGAGTNSWQQMEKWANAISDTSKLTAAQLSLYNQVKGLEGGDPNANLGVTDLHNGMWTLANGQQISYTDAQNMYNNFQQTGASSATTPVWSLTHMAPNFNTARVSQWGTYDPTTGATTQVTDPLRNTQPITINVNVAGVLGTKEQIAQEIADTLQKNNFYNFGNMRLSR